MTKIASTAADYRRALDDAIARTTGTRLQRVVRQPLRLVAGEVLLRASRLRQKGVVCSARLFWGETMHVVMPEFMSNHIFRFGFSEPDMSAMLITALKPGMTFVDVGAHFGYATRLGAALVGDRGEVHAFEPTPSTYAVLCRNAKGATNITTRNMAAHSVRTRLPFNDYGVRYSTHNSFYRARPSDAAPAPPPPGVREVEAIPLDVYCEEHGVVPDVVKIDAESAEHHVLLGMEHVIRQRRPAIVMEVGDLSVRGAARSSDLVTFLRERRYRVLHYLKGDLIEEEDQSVYAAGNRLFVPIEQPCAQTTPEPTRQGARS